MDDTQRQVRLCALMLLRQLFLLFADTDWRIVTHWTILCKISGKRRKTWLHLFTTDVTYTIVHLCICILCARAAPQTKVDCSYSQISCWYIQSFSQRASLQKFQKQEIIAKIHKFYWNIDVTFLQKASSHDECHCQFGCSRRQAQILGTQSIITYNVNFHKSLSTDIESIISNDKFQFEIRQNLIVKWTIPVRNLRRDNVMAALLSTIVVGNLKTWCFCLCGQN